MIAIIDYKAGNLASVARALNHLGFECQITSDANTIKGAERVIFPGVGSAGQSMQDLQKMGLDRAIHDLYESGKPFLGICLGAQIILEESEENQTTCLQLLAGTVKRFSIPLHSGDGSALKVPHMGWNEVALKRIHPVFKGVTPGCEFYFVHSYYPAPTNTDTIIGTTDYGITFTSVLGSRNLIAVQFHPEKSGLPGLTVLKNFCSWDGKDEAFA
ncbi:MAG: imidazole glycerol phosphate synthase subunit HisH [Deltaproteobacteria bacterium]|nr:imidazole glycerol phosphate synthase subunit HisH [Deltaproteobacteria bacterium]MBW2339586.1 imidazole glycerol phosphate synthase subunit HisH [Deltaproteobacteria bacterium]